MKIISYNVNGIRAALNKGFAEWLKESPDILCLQELKALPEQMPDFYSDLGYEMYWETAVKKGYSGVGILTKKRPKNVESGCGNELYDNEGRVIELITTTSVSCVFTCPVAQQEILGRNSNMSGSISFMIMRKRFERSAPIWSFAETIICSSPNRHSQPCFQ